MPAHILRNYVHPLRSETDVAVQFVAKYIAAIESQIENIERAELQEVDNWLSGFGADSDEYDFFHKETQALIEDGMIPAVRYSMVVFCHTTFETQIARICKAVKEEKDIPITVSQLSGSEI